MFETTNQIYIPIYIYETPLKKTGLSMNFAHKIHGNSPTNSPPGHLTAPLSSVPDFQSCRRDVFLWQRTRMFGFRKKGDTQNYG